MITVKSDGWPVRVDPARGLACDTVPAPQTGALLLAGVP